MNKWHKLALRELALMFGIFRQPAATIAALRRETRWLIPFGMLLLVVFINARLTQEIAALEFDDLLQSLLQFTGEGEALPEEDPLAAPDLMTQLLLLGGVTLLGRWLLALLLRFVSRVFLRREVSFRLLFTFSIY
nr:hypothetical protein [bacterium]